MPWGQDATSQQALLQYLQGMLGTVHSAGTSAKIQAQINQILSAQQQAKQDSYMSQVQSAVSPYLSGNVGFDPAQLAAMKAGFVDNVGNQFQSALANTKMDIARRGGGGMMPSGGMEGRTFGNLEAARAGTTSMGLRDIDLQNLQRMLANKQWATGVLGGMATSLNPAQYQAPNANLFNVMAQSQANSGLGSFLKPFLSSLGQGAASALTGGLSGVMGNMGSMFQTPGLGQPAVG